jgi:hypothetical protein
MTTALPDFDNTNRGALFRNDAKTEETHPDYRGSINVGGVADNAQPKKSIGASLNDQVPF